jgi:hypothetical protein
MYVDSCMDIYAIPRNTKRKEKAQVMQMLSVDGYGVL